MAKYKIFYKLTHASGELVDASLDTPFEFEVGDGQLDPCLESCIKEAKVGKLQIQKGCQARHQPIHHLRV